MRKEEIETKERAMQILEFLGIGHLSHTAVGTLPLGQQRLVEFARAMAGGPNLMLLDEPLAGLSAREADSLEQKIQTLRDNGISILFVEHEMKAVMRIAKRITVLSYGRKIAEGSPAEVVQDKEVIEAKRGFIRSWWCGDEACEDKIKEETMATIRVIPLKQEAEQTAGHCIYCRRKGRELAYFARAY
jgi:ABC-type branched-subunit amino acid transport system ATPase component